MNLAIRDIRRHPGRFAISCIGVGLLLTLVLSYRGIYNGLVYEALALINNTGADIWVVQRDTRGPFAEASRLPQDVRFRMGIITGVAEASPFIFYSLQRQRQGKPLRFTVVGYDLHSRLGGPSQIIAGRGIMQDHHEMVADKKLKLPLGTKLRIGLVDYTVVGLTSGMVGTGGDPLVFFSLADAQEIQFEKDNWAIRSTRARAISAYSKALPTQPTLSSRLAGEFADNTDLRTVNAVLVRLEPGVEPKTIVEEIERWEHFSAYTTDKQKQLMLAGSAAMAKRQTGLFQIVLTIVATVIIAQVIYTMTLEKLKPIALLKLIGAQNRVVIWLVLQESLTLGLIAYAVAFVVGRFTFNLWPRLVLVRTSDQLTLLGMVIVICVLASALGIRRALKVEASAALQG